MYLLLAHMRFVQLAGTSLIFYSIGINLIGLDSAHAQQPFSHLFPPRDG